MFQANAMTTVGRNSQHVAVIGAGAAGLVCARELLREQHKPVVFEQSTAVGGVWVCEPNNASSHSPMYEGLVTNLTKEQMQFSDFAFPDACPEYPKRAQVLAYLEAFADQFAIRELVRFRTKEIGRAHV